MNATTPERRSRRGGYTLIEVLIVVTILGIAATMVVPAFSHSSTLRLQGAVRTMVSDITQIQSDAVALQVPQAIVFERHERGDRYVLAPVLGNALDLSSDVIIRRQIGGEEFGNARFGEMSITANTLVFDELGGPVASPGSAQPAPAQFIDLESGTQRYRVWIEAFTGRVTVQELPEAQVPPREDD